MPYQMRPYRPRRARMGVAGALVQGAALAYRNRQAAWELGQAAKRVFTRKPKAKPSRSRPSAVISGYGGGNDLTIKNSKATLHKRPKGTKGALIVLRKQLQSLMQNEIYRFQNISNYDTNVGALLLRNELNTSTGVTLLPIHVYDLSSCNNVSTVAPGQALGWTALTNDAAVVRNVIPGQNATGGADSAGLWRAETDTTFPASQSGFHNWTSIKLNLYGARKRTTQFTVTFVTIRDDFANFQSGSGANLEMQQLVQYLARPLIYSNLQTDVRAKANRYLRVIKQYKYYVSASQTTDVDTAVGKIANANIFLRHNTKHDLDWHNGDAGDIIPHNQVDGLDFVQDSTPLNFPRGNKRVFMILSAFAPEQASAVGTPAVDANRDPTYDIIIRNSWSFGRGV